MRVLPWVRLVEVPPAVPRAEPVVPEPIRGLFIPAVLGVLEAVSQPGAVVVPLALMVLEQAVVPDQAEVEAVVAPMVDRPDQ